MKQVRFVLGLLILFFVYTSTAQNFSKIDSITNAEIQLKSIAGGVAYLYHDNQLIFNKAFGHANLADPVSREQHVSPLLSKIDNNYSNY